MKKLLLILLACGLSLAHSQAQNKEMTLSGKIKNIEPTTLVTLEEVWNNQVNTVDTLELGKDGHFSTQLEKDEPNLFRINIENRQFVLLLLGDRDVKVVVDASDPSAKPEVKNSKETDKLYEFSDLMGERQAKVQLLEADFQKAVKAKDQVRMEELKKQYMAYEEEFSGRLKGKISEMGVSVASFFALSTLDWDKEFLFADSMTQQFIKQKPDSRYTKILSQKADALRTTAIGSEAPEIALPNPEGEVVKLSSLRGKYVLLDFWASWCGPCRRENPNVVRMFNKYHDQGFEIYSVSLDKKKEKWMEGIEKDNLTWTHVSDLQYFNSSAARTYQVNAIPFTLLLDKDGKIIAKNLRGEALEAKLAEIFGE